MPEFESWRIAWNNYLFKWISISFLLILIVYFIFVPGFMQFIQARPGVGLRDPILDYLPAMDLSILIFICIYFPVLYILFRAVKDPMIFIVFGLNYTLVVLVRFITLYYIALEPPAGIIPMSDPLTNVLFYGGSVVDKDLFFSGHTSTLFLIGLSLKGRWEKIISYILLLVLSVALLIQHIHYTVDILFALIISGIIYRITWRWVIAKYLLKNPETRA